MNIDCRKSGLAKYKTHADNNFEQFCYYDQIKKDRLLNKFLAKRVEQNNKLLIFKIDSVKKFQKTVKQKLIKQL